MRLCSAKQECQQCLQRLYTHKAKLNLVLQSKQGCDMYIVQLLFLASAEGFTCSQGQLLAVTAS